MDIYFRRNAIMAQKKSFIEKVKKAPKKDLLMAGGCVIAVIALTAYYFIAIL